MYCKYWQGTSGKAVPYMETDLFKTQVVIKGNKVIAMKPAFERPSKCKLVCYVLQVVKVK